MWIRWKWEYTILKQTHMVECLRLFWIPILFSGNSKSSRWINVEIFCNGGHSWPQNRATIPKSQGQKKIGHGDLEGCTIWGPRSIAKLVPITPITMVYGTQITIVTGAYESTYNWGASHCRDTSSRPLSQTSYSDVRLCIPLTFKVHLERWRNSSDPHAQPLCLRWVSENKFLPRKSVKIRWFINYLCSHGTAVSMVWISLFYSGTQPVRHPTRWFLDIFVTELLLHSTI